MWRPDNWYRHSNAQPSSGAPNHESFEAGADAMLGALFKEASKYGAKWFQMGKTDSGDILIYLDG